MAQWTETQEPYIKVIETVKSAALNPTAGEDLIIGVTLISDAGPSIPTLIANQSDFMKTYASGDVTEEYVKSLDSLYSGDNPTLASTMWQNAYRLSGSNTLLVCRASKGEGINYSKPLIGDLNSDFIMRDGILLKRVPQFKIVIDQDEDDASHDQDGWSIAINGVGVFGNRTTDEGAQYDYFVNSLPELVDQLNETPSFFSPSFKYYSDERGLVETTVESDVRSVIFEEVYLGSLVLDVLDARCQYEGKCYLITCQPDWEITNPTQYLIDLNSVGYSDFVSTPYYATNVYNSSTELKIRIRRFNHDAVSSKTVTPSISTTSDSPWVVLSKVLDTFTASGTKEPSETVLERDFYEVCVVDPSIASEPQYFNLGNIPGRGDISASELNDLISMIQVNLPDNLRDLGLNYYGYDKDEYVWKLMTTVEGVAPSYVGTVSTLNDLYMVTGAAVGDIYRVGSVDFIYYQFELNGTSQIYADLRIDPTNSKLLEVSDTDLLKAIDLISLDEVYVTEGLCDLGNTEPGFQSYMANLAINENYFYPASTILSTNYLTIANSAAKLSQDSYKLYLSTPWDIDTGTFGWKYFASPGVLYWEAVARNKRNNSEFAPIFGQSTGIVQYQSPYTEFNKKTRQLLLTKKINSVLWNNQTSAWNMNDNFTKQSVDTIMSDEGNSRLAVRISKAMPVLLKQFIGWKINSRLWTAALDVINFWFRFTILPMGYTIDDYRVVIDDSNNPEEIQRQNKMVVNLYVRYQRSLKYVLVYHDILDVGMDLA